MRRPLCRTSQDGIESVTNKRWLIKLFWIVTLIDQAARIPVLFMAPCQVGARPEGGRRKGFLTVGRAFEFPTTATWRGEVTERTCL
jgi:hypothetical protein